MASAPPSRWHAFWHKALSHMRLRLTEARCLTALGALGEDNGAVVHKHRTHLDYLGTLRAGVAVRVRTGAMLGGARVRQRTEEAKRLSRQDSTIITEVESESALKSLALWQQGDAELSTLENVAKRSALHRAPAVLEVLQAFWAVEIKMGCASWSRTPRVPRSRGRARGPVPTSNLAPPCARCRYIWSAPAEEGGRTKAADRAPRQLVTFEGYQALYLRVYKTLLETWGRAEPRTRARTAPTPLRRALGVLSALQPSRCCCHLHTHAAAATSTLTLLLRGACRRWDEDDAHECIADDWAADAHGGQGLSREDLHMSLFELAGHQRASHEAPPPAHSVRSVHVLSRGVARVRRRPTCGPRASTSRSTPRGCGRCTPG